MGSRPGSSLSPRPGSALSGGGTLSDTIRQRMADKIRNAKVSEGHCQGCCSECIRVEMQRKRPYVGKIKLSFVCHILEDIPPVNLVQKLGV